MKIFIWNRVNHATDSYHHEGGVAVISLSLEEARRLLEKKAPKCGALIEPPDFHSDIITSEQKVFIFPDAGCC